VKILSVAGAAIPNKLNLSCQVLEGGG